MALACLADTIPRHFVTLCREYIGKEFWVYDKGDVPIYADLSKESEQIGTASMYHRVQVLEIGFHFFDPTAKGRERFFEPRARVFVPRYGIEGWISISRPNPEGNGRLTNAQRLIVPIRYYIENDKAVQWFHLTAKQVFLHGLAMEAREEAVRGGDAEAIKAAFSDEHAARRGVPPPETVGPRPRVSRAPRRPTPSCSRRWRSGCSGPSTARTRCVAPSSFPARAPFARPDPSSVRSSRSRSRTPSSATRGS